ncbi:MAG: CHAP domain-containing protein [Blautia sp.]|nr:CHAP domain-containing protein [Blautia sp.]
MAPVLDLSQWNTITDWDAVRESCEAVILRCGYTLSASKEFHICADQRYVAHRAAIRQRGIPLSLYYTTGAVTPQEAQIEASYVAGECRDLSGYVLPVFVDSELILGGKGRADNLIREQRTKCVRAFCAALQAQGVPAGIYASDSWMTDQLDMDKLPFSLWVAAWGASRPRHEDYVLWQYSNSGTIPGINGRVDMSTRDRPWLSARDRIIDLEISEVGYLEKASDADLYSKKANAGSANYTKYTAEMHRLQPRNMDHPAPWCASFQCWAFTQILGLDGAKKALCGDIDDYCPALVAQFQKAGRWHSTPEVGDLVFFGQGGGEHVGLVYQISAGMIRTIEGNTSSSSGVVSNGGGVWSKSYTIGYSRIAGYGRPKYD